MILGNDFGTNPELPVRRPSHSAMTPAARIKLTPREEAIARAVLNAQSNKAIAADLGITEQSVKNRLTLLYRKLGVSSRLQLMRALIKDAGK